MLQINNHPSPAANRLRHIPSLFLLLAALTCNCLLFAQATNFGNLYIPSGGNVALKASFTNSPTTGLAYQNNGNFYLTGDLTNNQASVTPGSGTTYFNGTTLQTINGTQPMNFNGLELNNNDYLQLSSDVSVSGALTLTDGIINSSSANLLTLGTGASVAGSPGVGAFVNGPMAWQTNTAAQFDFPIGITSPSVQYQPVSVLTVTPSGTSTFVTEYKAQDPTGLPYNGTFADPALNGLLNNKLWTIDKTGSATARVILNYGGNPGAGGWTPVDPGVSSNVAVANFASSNWHFEGGSFNGSGPIYETRYYSIPGVVYSGVLSNISGPFTIGHGSNTVLPVTLLTFDARLQHSNDGLLSWTATNTKDLAGFELQYSTSGNSNSFTKLAYIADNGGSTYSYLHLSLASGNHYYRILTKEKNGSSSISAIKRLAISAVRTTIQGLRQTIVRDELTTSIISSSNQAVQGVITDALGRVIATSKNGLQAGSNQWRIRTQLLAAGMYFLNVQTADGIKATLRFVKE